MSDTRELPAHFDFSNDGREWVCFQANTRKPLTMEYRNVTCPELPYFAIELQEYFRFCRVHIEEPVVGADGLREYSKDEIRGILLSYYPEYFHDFEIPIDAAKSMAKEILRLRDQVSELEKVVNDE